MSSREQLLGLVNLSLIEVLNTKHDYNIVNHVVIKIKLDRTQGGSVACPCLSMLCYEDDNFSSHVWPHSITESVIIVLCVFNYCKRGLSGWVI